jgi:hypothetical protein
LGVLNGCCDGKPTDVRGDLGVVWWGYCGCKGCGNLCTVGAE